MSGRSGRERSIVWADTALAAFEGAVARIAARAAQGMVQAVDGAVKALSRRNTGRPGRVDGTFEKSLPKWRYIIAYELRAGPEKQKELVILRLVHTSRHWPANAWPK